MLGFNVLHDRLECYVRAILISYYIGGDVATRSPTLAGDELKFDSEGGDGPGKIKNCD